jgi:hypothetical protein
MMCGLALLVAIACSDDPPDSATGTALPATQTGTSSATPTEDPEEALTPEESEWLAVATTVGPEFVSGAFEAIARDRDDERALFSAAEAEGGPIEDSVPAEAPGRFASAHAALLAAREDLMAFRDAGISRAETGTEYDALLAAYEQAIVGWALLVGIDLPE